LSAQQAPLFEWQWVATHLDQIVTAIWEHLQLTAAAVGIGMAISLPLAVLSYRRRRFYAPVTRLTGLLYSIPSLALFALLVPYTGLSTTTAEIGLVSYTLLILIRNTVVGLDAVPPEVSEAALGMGFSDRQVLWRVQLPLALPVIVAGIRIATVTTIGLVTVTALIGKGALGALILDGLNRSFPTPILVGAGLSVLLAIAADVLLLAVQRALTPWVRRAGEARGAGTAREPEGGTGGRRVGAFG
jgi:osmoprotectant transport system permease protein